MFSFSSRSRQRMEGVHPKLIAVAELAITISRIDFGIPQDGGLRTAERQKHLHDKGASKCDGYVKKSYHQTGRALDVYAFVDGEASWDELPLTHVAAAMLQAASQLGVKLEWGGFWPWDKPHFQLSKDEK